MSLTIGLILGSVFCLIHLAIGLTLGWRFGRAASFTMQFAVPAFPPPNRAQVEHVLPTSRDVSLQLDEWSAANREAPQVKAEALSQPTNESEIGMNGLHQNLECNVICNEPIPAKPRPAGEASEEWQSFVILTNEQLDEILRGVGDPNDDTTAQVVRYRFQAKQPLAGRAKDGSVMPFTAVQCHDLSCRDLRYFIDDFPVEELIVVGLGLPNPVKWLAAEIEDYRSAFMYGRVGYLVKARFRASLDKRQSELVTMHGNEEPSDKAVV